MWKRVLKRCHPDTGGDHSLFIWVNSVFEHVAGDTFKPPRRVYDSPPRHPPRHPPRTETADRVQFSHRFASFAELTEHAVAMAQRVPHPFAGLLRLLDDCLEVGPEESVIWRQQQHGATYKSLAALAYRANLSRPERVRWYRIAESAPLAQRHIGHIIMKLQSDAAA